MHLGKGAIGKGYEIDQERSVNSNADEQEVMAKYGMGVLYEKTGHIRVQLYL